MGSSATSRARPPAAPGPPGLPRSRAGRWLRQWRRRETLIAYAFVAPWLVGMLVFYIGPTVASLVYSLTEYPIIAAPTWTGLDNYREIFRDHQFYTALKATSIYTVFSVLIYIGAALGFALLCNRRLPGVGVVRTIVFLPSLVPVFALAMLWGWLFNADFGLVNYVLGEVGIPSQQWFQSNEQALPLMITISLWTIGSAFVVFLAGLQSIPQDLYEAITVDGAGPLRRFWHVTLPMLSPVILFNLVIGIILSFQVFDIAWALSSGGQRVVQESTLFFVLYIWRKAFEEFEMGYASALAWLLFLLIIAVTALIFRTARWWVHYEGQR